MQQKRLTSLIEVSLNVLFGFFISLTAWPYVGELYNIPYTYHSHIGITLIFTVLSVVRGYIVRRFFARGFHLAATQLTKRIISCLH